MPAVQLVPLRHGEPEPAQVPAAQTSVVVHALPSEHALPVEGPQVPFTAAPAATEQAWQSDVPPPQAVLQHTPSTQKPVPHCTLEVQSEPGARLTESVHVSRRGPLDALPPKSTTSLRVAS